MRLRRRRTSGGPSPGFATRLFIVVSVASLTCATSARASYGFQITPSAGPAGSTLQLSFRAPYEEVEDCCSEDLYYMEVRGATGRCLRRAFPHAQPERKPRVVFGSFGEFGDVRTNGKRLGHRYVHAGDTVVIRFHAPPCAGLYRGEVTYSYLTEDEPSGDKVIGRFTVRVTGSGVLAFTGFDVRAAAILGAVMLLAGLGSRRLLAS